MNEIIRVDSKSAKLFSQLYTAQAMSGEESLKKMIADHLKRLSPDDRYLRFCSTTSDASIDKYVDRLDFSKDGIFISFDKEVEDIVGFLHASRLDDHFESEYELGLTVDMDLRGTGLGYDMFAQAVAWARSLGGKRLYVNCLSKNKAMQKIAEKFKMETHSIDYETKEGTMELNKYPNIFAYLFMYTANNITMFDKATRKQVHEALQTYTESFSKLIK